jgi:hypothetical protein
VNIYKEILRQNLPRLLSLYNLDACSATYGFGDRLYWGWKIADFANGTMQGGVHALAIALKLGLLEDEAFTLNLIDAAIKAIPRIQARNGSMSEAYPGENSFCVTALVAFDVLSAIRLLDHRLEKRQRLDYLQIIRPLIKFITLHDEEHAVISNHLATAAAAITLWSEQSGEDSRRNLELLDRIFKHQSEEGWFQEYEGADPGYQTLCTYYLFCIYQLTGDEQLLERLKKSATFLKYYVHPDLTIGGLYGSRNTDVYYPAGIVGLAPCIDDFAFIADSLQKGIGDGRHLLPQSIDIENFVPLINAYAEAAFHYDHCSGSIKTSKVHAPYKNLFVHDFKDAGIYVQSTETYYAIVNYKKGGVIKVFNKKTARIDFEDGGIFGIISNGKRFSTQQFDDHIRFDSLSIRTNFYIINEKYPSPFSFIILRILSLSLFKSITISNLFKRKIVQFFMTDKNKINGMAERQFEFTEDKILIYETIAPPKRTQNIGHYGKCKAIHMASSGYCLKQDQELPLNSEIVEFRIRK